MTNPTPSNMLWKLQLQDAFLVRNATEKEPFALMITSSSTVSLGPSRNNVKSPNSHVMRRTGSFPNNEKKSSLSHTQSEPSIHHSSKPPISPEIDMSIPPGVLPPQFKKLYQFKLVVLEQLDSHLTAMNIAHIQKMQTLEASLNSRRDLLRIVQKESHELAFQKKARLKKLQEMQSSQNAWLQSAYQHLDYLNNQLKSQGIDPIPDPDVARPPPPKSQIDRHQSAASSIPSRSQTTSPRRNRSTSFFASGLGLKIFGNWFSPKTDSRT